MAFQNVADELKNKFPGLFGQSKTTTDSGTTGSLPLNVYSFTPHDRSLDHADKKRMKKRVYAETRPVKRKLICLDSAQLKDDHTVCRPVGASFKKLTEAGRVAEILTNRSWTEEDVRFHVQNAVPFENFHFLWQVSSNSRSLSFCKDTDFLVRLKDSKQKKNVYVLQVRYVLYQFHNIVNIKICMRI